MTKCNFVSEECNQPIKNKSHQMRSDKDFDKEE